VFAKGLVVSALLFLGGCATYVATSGGVVIKEDGGTTFTAGDRTAIRDYFKKSTTARKPLPAGIVVRKRLPDGVAIQPLAPELERRLSPLPAGCQRVRVGADVVLYESESRIVLDIARGSGN
jgi:hypothetical protein